MRKACLIAITLLAFADPALAADTWRGLVVAPEDRCATYNKHRDYPYSQSVEAQIVAALGGRIYGPYTKRTFSSTRDTDIEHIVATSEAHDSGLCAASAETRKAFASDLLNLTLAGPKVNRHEKSGKDAAEWMPRMNKCWFAQIVVDVHLKWGLTIDRREADALERVLAGCTSTELIFAADSAADSSASSPHAARENPPARADALCLYDDNRNGRITCKEARRHGIAPVRRGHPAYRYMRDRDGDGIVCE